jgi:hypothetical protein
VSEESTNNVVSEVPAQAVITEDVVVTDEVPAEVVTTDVVEVTELTPPTEEKE